MDGKQLKDFVAGAFLRAESTLGLGGVIVTSNPFIIRQSLTIAAICIFSPTKKFDLSQRYEFKGPTHFSLTQEFFFEAGNGSSSATSKNPTSSLISAYGPLPPNVDHCMNGFGKVSKGGGGKSGSVCTIMSRRRLPPPADTGQVT